MPFARFRELVGKLHFRLTAWYSITLCVMVVVSLFCVREALRLALMTETDQALADDVLEARLIVNEFLPDVEKIRHELERKASTHAHRELFVELLDVAQQPKWHSASTPEALLDRALKAPVGRAATRSGFRVLQEPLPRSVDGARSILLGVSLEPVVTDVAKLTQLMLMVGGCVLLVAPLGGYWLASRATRPLARIIDTTARLHPSNLDERLQLRGTRDELDRLSMTVNGLLDRIAAYLEQNRQFTANAAHELRSPLAAIQNSLEVGLETERSTDEYKDLIGETLEQCGALRDLVNQLLLLAESDAGQMIIGPNALRLDVVIGKAREMFAGVAENRNIRLVVDRLEPVEVYGDASRLRQVINNLIDNAIKFTDSGDRIGLELFEDPATGSVVMRVSDTGVGIPPADLPHVFERFYQADKSRVRKETSGGTGLGLSICQSIVAAHNGSIEADSAPGHGTTITVRLPSVRMSRPNDIGLPLRAIEGSPAPT